MNKAIQKWSNVAVAERRAVKYLGPKKEMCLSTRRAKKYMVRRPGTNTWVHFGEMGYEDYTKHRDTQRRRNYLTRSARIRGNWRADKYSPNNLARHILW